MPSGLDLLEGKAPVANAPKSNLAPFDIKLSEEANPLEEAQKLVGTSVTSGMDLLEPKSSIAPTDIPTSEKASVVKDSINIDMYDPEKIAGRVMLSEVNEPKPEPKSEPESDSLTMSTLKALVKVPTSIAASMALFPGAGIAGMIEMIPRINPNPEGPLFDKSTGLDGAMKVYNEIMSVPSKLITTPAEAKAVENLMLVMKPIEMSGEGWKLIGREINNSLVELGLAPTLLEPLLATYGEAAAIFAIPGMTKKVGNSNWFRRLTIKERGLVVQSLAETQAKNPKMTEGQLLRAYDNPLWRKEALSKRSIEHSYNEVKNFAEAKTLEAKMENIDVKQSEIDQIPNEVIRRTQQKVLDVEKKQAELVAEQIHKKVLKAELKEQGEEVKDIKDGTEAKTEIIEDDRSMLESLGYEADEITKMKPEDVERILRDEGEIVESLNELTAKEQNVLEQKEVNRKVVKDLAESDKITEDSIIRSKEHTSELQ